MKKILIGTIFLSNTILNAQSGIVYYINPELQEKVTINHSVRLSANELMKEKYEKINETYKKIDEKVAEVLVIKELLHSYLVNVHSVIGESRILKNIYSDLTRLFSKLTKLAKLSTTKPQYGILCNDLYLKIFEEGLEMQSYLSKQVLHSDPRYLLDNVERVHLLNEVRFKIRKMNLNVDTIVYFIEGGDDVAYWRHIDILNDIFVADEAIIQDIIYRAKLL